MCKYEMSLKKCQDLTPYSIIKTFDLLVDEVKFMKYLYGKQKLKMDILNAFYGDKPRAELSKILGSLKKKGLIYSVIDLPGWLGTEIKVFN